jgi:hypothetical protein
VRRCLRWKAGERRVRITSRVVAVLPVPGMPETYRDELEPLFYIPFTK